MTRRALHVEEAPVWIDVNDVRLTRTTATPQSLDALAVGRLAADGFIRDAADVLALDIVDEPPGCVGIRVRVDSDREQAARRVLAHCDEHGCGVLGMATCLQLFAPAGPPVVAPTPHVLTELFRELTAAEERLRGERGGMHSCALVADGRLGVTCTDIGRHGAVDKAIGAALLEGRTLAGVGLVTTARISGEIATKAARVGLAWVATRSIPTSLALRIATAAGMPLIARAGSTEPRVHAAGSAP
jgi:FdhD protein